MNTLNICVAILAAISFNNHNTCPYMVFGDELGVYSCEAAPRDIYESTCYGGQDIECYGEDEYPSYRVAKVSDEALKVTTTYKGRTFISLWSTKGQGEEGCTAYRKMDSGMARVLAAYGEVDSAATYTILERLYSQDEGISFAKVYTDKNHYTLFTCQGASTLENASYVQDEAWWVTDRLTSCGSTNIASEEAYKILAAASLAKLDYKWIRAEVDRSLHIASGHKNYLYRVAAGYIEAV